MPGAVPNELLQQFLSTCAYETLYISYSLDLLVIA